MVEFWWGMFFKIPNIFRESALCWAVNVDPFPVRSARGRSPNSQVSSNFPFTGTQKMQVLAARVPSQGDVFSRHGSHEQYIARHILHMKNMLLLTIAMLNYQRVCLKIPSLQPRRPCGEDNSLFPGKLCDSRGRSVSGTWYMCIHLLKYTRFMVSIYILYIW